MRSTMEWNLSSWIFDHWQRKLVAVLAALVIWIFVNNSITDTKTVSNIAVKVINLPSDKAIIGLLPNGLLSRRVTLTLSGTKDVINDLEASDIEVLLDASAVDSNEWVVDITKKNLVSLNPAINLARHITQVEHSDFVIPLSRLVTAKVPVDISTPIGEAPNGYIFIDVWPQRLFQTITGPEEEVKRIEAKGLQLQFDLSQISKSDLDQARTMSNTLKDSQAYQNDDEVFFFVPNKWKKVVIPYPEQIEEELNDPDARYLHISFLQKQLLPLNLSVPIRVYYPVKTLEQLNPTAYPLALNPEKMAVDKGAMLIKTSLYVYAVSHFFLDTVKNNLEIAIIASPREERQVLQWSLEVVDALELENTYVAVLLANEQPIYGGGRRREQALRQRFRNYMQGLGLYQGQNQKLQLECVLETGKIVVK